MSPRARVPMALLTALAVIAAIAPARTLLTSTAWMTPCLVVVAVVAVSGVLLRLLTRRRLLVVLGQLVAGAAVIVVRFNVSDVNVPGVGASGGTDPSGGPMAWVNALLTHWNDLLLEAGDTIASYAAPAPLVPGITLVLMALVLVVAVCADAFAVTWDSPAAAGLPLLTAYLVTAANGAEALAVSSFVPPVALWLVMLFLSSRSHLGSWATLSSAAGGRRTTGSLATAAALTAVAGVVVALVVAALTPHLPPRYVADGLGNSVGSGGRGTVGYSDTLDLTRSLTDTNNAQILRYTTTGTANVPLRVVATSYYSRGQWMVGGIEGQSGQYPTPLPNTGVRREYTISVTDNQLEAPRIASPAPALSAEVDGAGNTVVIDPVTRDVTVGQAVSGYRVTYADTVPAPDQIDALAGAPMGDDVQPQDVEVPEIIGPYIYDWSSQIIGDPAASALDKAVAIQNHLRDTSIYTYSLQLPDSPAQGPERVDPLLSFRDTRTGYCVQFATAMVMLARAEGIPARMAIGFLPGTFENGSQVVRANDAHAWPELYFPGVGWLRFEPTPGSRAGNAPPWAVARTDAGAAAGRDVDGQDETTTRPTTIPRPGATAAVPEQELADTADTSVVSARTLRVVGVVAAALLLVFLMPLTAWVLRRRRRAAADSEQERVETEWQRLTGELADLGMSPPAGATLRTTRDHLTRAAGLDPESSQALARVTATLERARYEPADRLQDSQVQQAREDIDTVGRYVRSTRARPTRIRAFLLPGTAVRWWRSRLRR